ncbi:MAG: hypothetical protein LWW81_10580 [Rhodocyclales bacterium]|nr:hypothetical protein [Rhodocyclales bacterium]
MSWWFDFLQDNLKKRGSLAKRPVHDAECYYHNPQGHLAAEVDLCRDWQPIALAGYPTVWEMLSRDAKFDGVRHAEVLNALAGRTAQTSYPLVILYEWIASSLLGMEGLEKKRGFYVDRPFARFLCEGYIRIFERVGEHLHLNDHDLESYVPEQQVSDRDSWWQNAPPYAAMLLLPMMATGKGECVRGATLLQTYKVSAERGGLVQKTCLTRDFPKKPKLAERLTKAMALDCYVKEKGLLAQLKGFAVKSPPESPEIVEKSAEEIAELVFGERTDQQETYRFAASETMPTRYRNPDATATITWDEVDDGPCFSFSQTIPALLGNKVDDWTVVIRSEASVNGKTLQDAVFGYVAEAEIMPISGKADTEMLTATVCPMFARFSLQYRYQSAKYPSAEVQIFPAGKLLNHHGVICINLSLGRLP